MVSVLNKYICQRKAENRNLKIPPWDLTKEAVYSCIIICREQNAIGRKSNLSIKSKQEQSVVWGFFRKSVLNYFEQFTGKYLCCRGLCRLETCNFIKKRLWYMCLTMTFAESLKICILKNASSAEETL